MRNTKYAKFFAGGVLGLLVLSGGFFVYATLPDETRKNNDRVEEVVIDDLEEEVILNGSNLMADDDLMKKYGDYFFEAEKRNPQLIELIQQSKSDFKPEDLGVAFPNKFIKLDDERTIALFSGCTPHDCAGTENLVAYDLKNEKAFVLVENSDSTKAYIFGNPDPEIRNLLLYEYLYH